MQNQSGGGSGHLSQRLRDAVQDLSSSRFGLAYLVRPSYAREGAAPALFDGAWLRHTVSILSVILVGYLWAQMTWVWLNGVQLDRHAESAVSASSGLARASQPTDLQALTRADPFFRTSVSADRAPTTDDVAAPETTLDLKLFGIRAGTDGSSSGAIIRTTDNTQRAFQEGQSLIDGVTLERILQDRVILNRGGIRESLFLLSREDRQSRPEARASESRMVRSVETLSIAALLSSLQLEPRMYDGRIDGFYIAPSASAASLQGTGLMPGDVIMAVNNTRLVSAERITDVMEELQSSSQAQIEIERDGNSEIIQLTIGGVRP